MSNSKVRICGKEPIYIPDDDCSECSQLEQRIDELEDTKLERGDLIAGTNITLVPQGDRGLVINGLDINLNNYYNKSETYSRSEVDDLIADLEGISIEVVTSLPASGTPNIIYFVKQPAPATGYDEYVWIASGNHYEMIGSTDVDLSGYYTSVQVDTLLNNKVDKETGKGLSSNNFTNILKTKLDGIETGAEKNRTYTAVTGKPTSNQTPAFGGTVTISQITQDATGQVTATDKTITIPNATATSSANGLMSSTDKTKLDGITWTKAGLLALLGYKETTITMTATDNTTATETFLVKN